MSEEDYASRDNTYRKYKEGKLREDPAWTLEKEMCMRRGALRYVTRYAVTSYVG
jgi:tubulin-folding cofactor B